MKRIFYIVVIALIIFWITIRIFGFYEKGNILSNEAAFDIHLNTDSLDVDKYFDLPAGTFNKDKHVILCKLPVNTSTSGFKPDYLEVKLGTGNINCDAEYTAKSYVKFNNTELNKNESKLLIVKKYAGQIVKKQSQTLRFFNENLNSSNIIAEKETTIEYKKGKINHLVISLLNSYDFCPL